MTDPIDDIANYKWSVFYCNKDDRRIIVPKRMRLLGWTLNFARWETWLMVVSFIMLAIMASYYSQH
jgi:uncharacterized membrane protein